MEQFLGKTREIEAEVSIGLGRVQLIREFWNEPIDISGTANEHRLELTLLPSPKSALCCFPDHWGPHRFEPMGQMFLLPAQHSIHAVSECRRQDSIVCVFDPASVATWFDDDLKWTDGRLQGTLDIANTSIRSLLLRIGEEVRQPAFASTTMIELIAVQIAIELSRHLIGIGEGKVVGGLSARRLRLIEDRLADSGAPPSLTELAGLCGISVRHLTRGFRVSRGRSIGSYVVEHSMNHAKQMLAAGMRVKSVAYTMGFTAPSNFATAFLRATGETPRQYTQRVNSRKAAPASPFKTH